MALDPKNLPIVPGIDQLEMLGALAVTRTENAREAVDAWFAEASPQNRQRIVDAFDYLLEVVEVRSAETAAAVRQSLATVLRSLDRLMEAKSARTATATNAKQDIFEGLQGHRTEAVEALKDAFRQIPPAFTR